MACMRSVTHVSPSAVRRLPVAGNRGAQAVSWLRVAVAWMSASRHFLGLGGPDLDLFFRALHCRDGAEGG